MRRIVLALTAIGVGAAVTLGAQGQSAEHAPILVPGSSVEQPGDHGVSAHTNHLIRVGRDAVGTSPSGETPASIAGAYQLGNLTATGGGTIVIVDAYDYPTALRDFNVFSTQFGLPTETSTNATAGTNAHFQVVYAGGPRAPRANCGWAQEAALDIEWAHAMAPNAKIVLVEAKSNSFADLFAAVDVANAIPDAQQMSMSWGGSEFSSEASNDTHFTHNGIVYFASSGDTGGKTIYPGVSPNVVSAGGTRLNRNSSGVLVSETGWSGSGGGSSAYEPRPAFQNAVAAVGSKRGVPDYSFDADPSTGVSVYDSTSCQGVSGWMVFGGTSVSSPSLAGIVHSAGNQRLNSGDELTLLYSGLGRANFRDIVSGTAGTFTAKTGWDFVTGIGSTLGLAGK